MFCPVWTVQYTDYLVLMEMEGADMPSYQVNAIMAERNRKQKNCAQLKLLPMGQPVDNVAGLKDALLNIGTGTSPGTGGMRPEFLTTLAEVMEEGDMTKLEDFSMLYLTGALPPWFYAVWGSVTTVPLFKTRERTSLRPVGVMTPLVRTLHSLVIKENRAVLTSFLEPQQLCMSLSGGHKLVNAVRMLLEDNPDFVCYKLDLRNAHNEVARAAIPEELEEETLGMARSHSAGSWPRLAGGWGEVGRAGGGGEARQQRWLSLLCGRPAQGCEGARRSSRSSWRPGLFWQRRRLRDRPKGGG